VLSPSTQVACTPASCGLLRRFRHNMPQRAARTVGISPVVRVVKFAVTRNDVITSLNQAWSEYRALADVSRSALCCHSSATRAPTANLPNSAQLGGTPYHSPKLHPVPCSSVGMRRGTDTQTHRQTHTDTQTHVTTIHLASSTTYAKCNKSSFCS